MIIPHFKKKKLQEKKYSHLPCPHCENTDGIRISSYFRYLAILLIPFFAFQKWAEVLCYNCKKEVLKKDQTRAIKLEVRNVKSSKGIPVWAFIGLIIVLINISITEIVSDRQDTKNLELLANPEANDVYGYYKEDKTMSTYKVIEVDADTVYISPNKFKTENKDKVDHLDKEANYKNYYFPKTKAELLKMYKEKTIFWIDRD